MCGFHMRLAQNCARFPIQRHLSGFENRDSGFIARKELHFEIQFNPIPYRVQSLVIDPHYTHIKCCRITFICFQARSLISI
jgi:hypothetical protein